MDDPFIEYAGIASSNGKLHGTMDYGMERRWGYETIDYCKCGNVKHQHAKKCIECDKKRRHEEADYNPDAIRERPKKDWDPIKYITMIRKQIQARKEK